ncbi:Glycerol-3-phosphate acyltransferase [Nymphon striatum]|nr:Glycerol-3-phosphate acyltransferase [Nymphon striatum]
MLRGIIETLHDYPDQEIQFIPVQIFWGRPVATQKHWLQVLFSDSWGLASRTRTFFRVLFHGRNTFIQYSEIISYQSTEKNRESLTVPMSPFQVMQRALSSFWNRFYSGIEVNNSEYLKSLALSHELVYVPCHRSHIDYLLLSYVIYFEGLAIPYIAAGKNLNMPVIGSILRGGGAFFIRRSFKGNELYSTVMFEYVAELIAKGIAIEYFVEGGRSRTGRLLQAKPGMLAMTVRGFLKYRKRPVAFIPVYIGYEKLLESKAYQAELSGEDKKSETFINSIDSNHGWASENYDDEVRPAWQRDVVANLSNQIMTRINQAATVNSINLIASVLLTTSNQSMDEKDLELQLEIYKGLIGALDYSQQIILTPRSGKDQISSRRIT